MGQDGGNGINGERLLSVENLNVRFVTNKGVLHAADNISLSLKRGEALGIVGESGCGKSAFAMAIPRLLPMPPAEIFAKRIWFAGQELTSLSDSDMRSIRGRKIGVIFQEPMSALSPLHRIGRQIEEAVAIHRHLPRAELRSIAIEWLTRVEIADPLRVYKAWPHELSGGMRQRVMIAMALVNSPDLIIADEPTTALDVTTQARILKLLSRLKGERSGLLLITHDMGVIFEMATRVAVMYCGQIVETAPCTDLFRSPLHPYTRALLNALPSAEMRGKRLPVIPGFVPSPFEWPRGCRFANRCAEACGLCFETPPMLRQCAEAHSVRCHRLVGGAK